MSIMNALHQALAQMPLVAILRGLEPERAADVALTLVEAGFTLIQVPLNGPDPFRSISAIANVVPTGVLVGAGNVLEPSEIWDLEDAGGQLVMSPNTNPDVIRAAREKNLYALPGVMTLTEVFIALDAGAHALRLFPAAAVPPDMLGTMLTVVPDDVIIMPEGGIVPTIMAAYWQAGARGFGIGRPLFGPDKSLSAIKTVAESYAAAARALTET